MNETKKSYFEARSGTGVPCGHHHRKIRAVIRCTDRLNKIVRSAGGEFCAFVAVRLQGTVPPGEESLKINTTVHRHDLEKGNMLSTISGKCEVCGKPGWVGDWPGEGGLVVDTPGRLVCDDCAKEDEA
jgi:hypothetical protein